MNPDYIATHQPIITMTYCISCNEKDKRIAALEAQLSKVSNDNANYRTGAYVMGLENKINDLLALLKEIEDIPKRHGDSGFSSGYRYALDQIAAIARRARG
jgi:hypothetical protein